MKNIIRRLKKHFKKHLMRQSFAAYDLDRKLAQFIRKRNGFFVETGANDGVQQSNSLYFEKYMGWTGLLIEPIPALAEKCRQNRPRCLIENCALVSADYQDQTIEMRYNDLMSVVKGAFGNEADENQHIETGRKFLRQGDVSYLVSVPARTLSSVLTSRGINQIDLLSLDVEGYEFDVLSGLDFERHAPKFILVETRHNKKQDIESLLSPRYSELSVLNANNSYSDILYVLNFK